MDIGDAMTEGRESLLARRSLRAVRVYRDPVGLHLFVGPWACSVSWSRRGYFANGSHYFTGWHRWAEDAELSCGSTKP